MWIVYSSWPSAFILLNSLQIKEKKEHVNLFCVSLLYALPKFSPSSDSMSETIFSVWLGRDFLVSSPWSIQLDYRDLFFFFPEVLLVFFFFPLLQPNLSFKLLLYHVLLFSSCNILFASVTETHASLPPKKQTKTKNPPGIKFKLRFYFFGADASHFRFQSWLLCSIVPSLRLYPC